MDPWDGVRLEQCLLLCLCLGGRFSSVFGHNTCGRFSYHRHHRLDNQIFTKAALEVKFYIPEKALTGCSSDCFRHPACKMFVLSSSSGECRRFKRAFSDLTNAVPADGFKYYAADCLFYKSNVCQAGFSLYADTEGYHCYRAGVWEYGRVCRQDEWTDLSVNDVPLPSPLVSGVTIDIRGSRSSDFKLFTLLRQKTSIDETALLTVAPDGTTFAGVYIRDRWQSTRTISPFPVAPRVVFDLQVVVSATHFQMKIDGADLIKMGVGLPLNISTEIQMFDWLTVERVKLTYP